jgi:formylglycine-generating enzyme required for sulfatase activity
MQFRDIVIALVVAAVVGVGAFLLLNRLDPMKLVTKPAAEPDRKSSDAPGPAPTDEDADPHKAGRFWLGKTAVTVGQFRRFLRESGYEYPPPLWEGPFGVRAVSPRDDSPMVNVNLRDARAFCDWLGKKEGRRWFLPTEAQWTQADEQNACAGNKWEWCELEGDTDATFATAAEDGSAREPNVRRPLRRASTGATPDAAVGGVRRELPFNARGPDTAFRVATTRAKPPAVVPTPATPTGRESLAEQLGLDSIKAARKAEEPWTEIPLVEIRPGR